MGKGLEVLGGDIWLLPPVWVPTMRHKHEGPDEDSHLSHHLWVNTF